MPVFAAEDTKEFISTEKLEEYTTEIGEKYDINPYILYSLTESESRGYIYAENGNCKGLTQINAVYHADRMKKLGITDIYDPYGNILLCADYLAELRTEKDDIYYILMRYNMATVTANKMYDKGEISSYAQNIVTRAGELAYEQLKSAKNAEKEQSEQDLQEQKQKNALAENEKRISDCAEDTLPKGGASLWTEWKTFS